MLALPEEIKKIFWQDNINEKTRRKWKLRFFDSDIQLIYPEDTLFPADDLFPVEQEPIYVIDNSQMQTESLKITESLCESDTLAYGECNAAQLEVTVADVLQDLTGKEFMVSVEVGDYEMSMGIYTVEQFTRQADRRMKKITAYDRMRKFSTDIATWYQGLKFPMSLREFRCSLCEYVGIQQIDVKLPLDDMQVAKTIEPKQLNGLDVIQAICEINGCFGHMDKTGRLKYQFLDKSGLYPSETLMPSEELFPSGLSDSENTEQIAFYKQSETTYEDYVTQTINRVQIRQEEGDIGALYPNDTGGSNTYVVEGNFLVYGKSADDLATIASSVYDQISGISYRPCKIVTAGLPWVEVGDGLVCYTSDDVIETYCLKRTISGIQGMMDTFEASGSSDYEENFDIQSQITQLEGKAAVIKKNVEEVSVRVTDLKNYTEAQFKVTAEAITAEVTRAKNEEEKLSSRITQTADAITLEVSRATKSEEALSTKITQTADAITLEVNKKVSKGQVTENLNSELKITGNKIEMTTGHFVINSKNLKVTEQGDLEASGKITAQSGRIGNWTIDDNGLVGDDGSDRSATIIGGHIEGSTMNVADGILNVEDGYGNSSAIVRIGDFVCSDEYGRSIFQSSDEMTGMSGNPSNSKGLYLWAGYRGKSDYAFVVNADKETHIRGSLHISGNLYLNGTSISGGSSSISGSVSSLKVGYDLDGSWGSDWLEIYPKNKPNINDYPDYEGMDYLYVYLERHYKS